MEFGISTPPSDNGIFFLVREEAFKLPVHIAHHLLARSFTKGKKTKVQIEQCGSQLVKPVRDILNKLLPAYVYVWEQHLDASA